MYNSTINILVLPCTVNFARRMAQKGKRLAVTKTLLTIAMKEKPNDEIGALRNYQRTWEILDDT